METPENTLAYCRQLLSLYEMEAITDARGARVYYNAFQICIMHGDQARASVIAQKAYETAYGCLELSIPAPNPSLMPCVHELFSFLQPNPLA